MRSFRPLYRETAKRHSRPRWTPPPALRWTALGVCLGAGVLVLSYGWRLEAYLLKVQRDPRSAVTLKWQKPFIPLIVADAVMFGCIPFAVPPSVKPKRRPIPDPGLSIFPQL